LSTGLSNHELIFFVRGKCRTLHCTKTIRFRNFKNFDEENFASDLNNFSLSNPDLSKNANELVHIFEEAFTDLLNYHAPLVVRTIKARPNEWIDDELKKLMHHRDHLKRKAKITCCKDAFKQYQILRNKINIACRKKKSKYFLNRFSNSSSSKEFWKTYKSLTNNNTNASIVKELMSEDKIVTNNKDLCDTIADSIIVKPNEKFLVNEELKCRISSLKTDYIPFSPNEICKEIKNRNVNTSNGLSQIPPKIVKQFSKELSPILNNIYNVCVSLGEYPKQWKTAIVTPLLKQDQNSLDPNSYRPISVLPFLSKVFESLIAKRITAFCDEHNLISPNQFGFRNRHSTIHALSHVTQQIYNSIDQGHYTIGIFIDLTKAFDSVPHNILVKKLLDKYNLPSYMVRILFSFLCDRFIKIKLGSYISEPYPLYASVPQGSTLSCILYNLFFNDICDVIEGEKDLYADDVASIISNSSFSDLILLTKLKLEKMNRWCEENGMKINWRKSYFMLFYHKRMKIPPPMSVIQSDSFQISRVSEFKYLGIWLDECLDFGFHVSKMISKIKPRIYCLMRLKRYIPKNKFPQVFRAIVVSSVEYGVQIWGVKDNLISKLQNVLNNALKSLFSPRAVSLDYMLESFNLLTLKEFSNYYLFLFAKLFTNDFIDFVPVALRDFVTNSTSQKISSRSENFVCPRPKTEFFKCSPKYRMIQLWNNLPNWIQKLNYSDFIDQIQQFIISKRTL
jgi:hypothetical protein